MGNTSATHCSCEENHWNSSIFFKTPFYAEKKVRATWNVCQTSMKVPTKEIWCPSGAISSIEPCTGGPGAEAPMSLMVQSENHLHQTGIFPSSWLLSWDMWRRREAPHGCCNFSCSCGSKMCTTTNKDLKCLHMLYCSISKIVLVGFCSVPGVAHIFKAEIEP